MPMTADKRHIIIKKCAYPGCSTPIKVEKGRWEGKFYVRVKGWRQRKYCPEHEWIRCKQKGVKDV